MGRCNTLTNFGGMSVLSSLAFVLRRLRRAMFMRIERFAPEDVLFPHEKPTKEAALLSALFSIRCVMP